MLAIILGIFCGYAVSTDSVAPADKALATTLAVIEQVPPPDEDGKKRLLQFIEEAQQGNVDSAWFVEEVLSEILRMGVIDAGKREIEALEYWHRQALEGKSPYALLNPQGTEWLLHKQFCTPQEERKLQREGFEILVNRADKDWYAFKQLYVCYMTGIGVEKDLDKAKHWYELFLKSLGRQKANIEQALQVLDKQWEAVNGSRQHAAAEREQKSAPKEE